MLKMSVATQFCNISYSAIATNDRHNRRTPQKINISPLMLAVVR